MGQRCGDCLNKSIVQQIFYRFSAEIWVEAGGRGGNTNEFLLPGVEREKVTGLEGGEKNMGGMGGWFFKQFRQTTIRMG